MGLEWNSPRDPVSRAADESGLLDRFSAAFRRVLDAGRRSGLDDLALVMLDQSADKLEATAGRIEMYAASRCAQLPNQEQPPDLVSPRESHQAGQDPERSGRHLGGPAPQPMTGTGDTSEASSTRDEKAGAPGAGPSHSTNGADR